MLCGDVRGEGAMSARPPSPEPPREGENEVQRNIQWISHACSLMPEN